MTRDLGIARAAWLARVSVIDKVASTIEGRPQPRGTIYVVYPSPTNWLHITYNTVEELVRVKPGGSVEPAAISKFRWVDDREIARHSHHEHAIVDEIGFGYRRNGTGEGH